MAIVSVRTAYVGAAFVNAAGARSLGHTYGHPCRTTRKSASRYRRTAGTRPIKEKQTTMNDSFLGVLLSRCSSWLWRLWPLSFTSSFRGRRRVYTGAEDSFRARVVLCLSSVAEVRDRTPLRQSGVSVGTEPRVLWLRFENSVIRS